MIVTDSGGRVVELSSTGSIRRQVPIQGDANYVSEWQDVPTDDLPAKVKFVSVRWPDNSLTALLSNGEVWEQYALHRDKPGSWRWRQIAD
jgi:hypothetical protein